MNSAAVAIPEKLFFKIGEVCDLTGVQAHVLRYWESEFPMLSPQKNRAGQRTYRKRDVEIALRIKELLYDDQYTIAGAKKRLATELRNPTKLKVVTSELTPATPASASSNSREKQTGGVTRPLTDKERNGVRQLTKQLQELLSILNADEPEPRSRRK
jgi:DNA-binding transcriptional MerR regulator